MGALHLDDSLAPGEFRELTEEELAALRGDSRE
jgi:16S rRNA U516 pseudouridylate synthase RsuA-like enzyme